MSKSLVISKNLALLSARAAKGDLGGVLKTWQNLPEAKHTEGLEVILLCNFCAGAPRSLEALMAVHGTHPEIHINSSDGYFIYNPSANNGKAGKFFFKPGTNFYTTVSGFTGLVSPKAVQNISKLNSSPSRSPPTSNDKPTHINTHKDSYYESTQTIGNFSDSLKNDDQNHSDANSHTSIKNTIDHVNYWKTRHSSNSEFEDNNHPSVYNPSAKKMQSLNEKINNPLHLNSQFDNEINKVKHSVVSENKKKDSIEAQQHSNAPQLNNATTWRTNFNLVYGNISNKLVNRLTSLHPHIPHTLLSYGYGTLMGRSILSIFDIELALFSIIAVIASAPQLYSHTRGALLNGAKVDILNDLLNTLYKEDDINQANYNLGKQTIEKVLQDNPNISRNLFSKT